MFLYGFFDYKDYINYDGKDMFSLGHIIYIFLALTALIVLTIIFRKTNHKKIDIYLKVVAIVIPLLDLIKNIWETYYFQQAGKGVFEFTGLLPIYLCSLFMYCMLLAAFSKGKLKEYSLAFLTTIGILGGLSNVFYLNMLNYYPLVHYASFTSINYHFMMSFTGFLLLSTGYYKPNKFTVLKAMVPVILLSIIAIPVNYALGSDYMQINRADGVPVINGIANYLNSNGLGILVIPLMYIVYLLMGYLIQGIYTLLVKLLNKKAKVSN